MLVDIQCHDESSLCSDDAFVIDTNVLMYIHRPQVEERNIIIAGAYSRFIDALRRRECKLVVSSLNLQEALNAIDSSCWKRYKEGLSDGHPDKEISRKDYRASVAERRKVKAEQGDFLLQIRQFYSIQPECISPGEVMFYYDTLDKHNYDPIDYIISLHYSTYGIITDDKDFTRDNDIAVYTLARA